jgi:fatty acid desaturase
MDMRGPFGNSRTNDGFWQRWWIHPLNDGLHAAHHLNSQVPFHRLRAAHEELVGKSKAYREKMSRRRGCGIRIGALMRGRWLRRGWRA